MLFWRGWSLHDRQSRFSDDLRNPAAAVHDRAAAAVLAVSRDRPSSRRVCRRRVALRATSADPARALRQSRGPLFILWRSMGLGHRFRSARSAGQLARQPRPRRAIDGRLHGVAHGHAAERHAHADLGACEGRVRVELHSADASSATHSASRCATTRSPTSGPAPSPSSTATKATLGRSAIASSRRNGSAAASSGCASTLAATSCRCSTRRRRSIRKARSGCSSPIASPRPGVSSTTARRPAMARRLASLRAWRSVPAPSQ